METFYPSPIEPAVEMSEFQVVNSKKKKSRKRRPGETSAGGSSNPHDNNPPDIDAPMANSTANPQRNRRKSSCSMPVSDKSDSSDLDSVHSLPVSAKLVAVSYADVASVVTPPVASEAPPKRRLSPTPFLNSVEHFPELCRSTAANTNSCFNASVTQETAPSAPSANCATSATNNIKNVSNVHVDSRPPVIIPVSKDPIDVSGLTFGFEVNEQLLALGSETPAQECDGVTTLNMADSFTARYLAPVVLHNYNHDKIVSYVGQGEKWGNTKHLKI